VLQQRLRQLRQNNSITKNWSFYYWLLAKQKNLYWKKNCEQDRMITLQEKSSYEPTVGISHEPPPAIPANLLSIGVEATSDNLGWVGLQAVRYRDLPTNEIHIPALAQHLLVLHTKPALAMNFRCQGVKREIPPPVGSITLIPAGSITECCCQGTRDAFHIHLDRKLLTRIATTMFELDISRSAVPPHGALVAPELRNTMLAVDTELRTGGIGGPLIIESLANVLAVQLIRHIFGLHRLSTQKEGGLSRRTLATIVDYIMANLNCSPTVEQMAALVQLSPDHFARQFKAATGLPPHQFVITRRVELAQRLLRERRGIGLADVAIRAGFSDQSQFSFHFKRIVGVTPGQFRASTKPT
jgi:AraC family transcriptional regulator